MAARVEGTGGDGSARESANAVFKRRSEHYIWPALLLAIGIHYLVLVGIPGLAPRVIEYDAAEPAAAVLSLLPPIQFEPPLPPIPRPPAPVPDPPPLDLPPADYPEPEPVPEVLPLPEPAGDAAPAPGDATPVPSAAPEPSASPDLDRFVPSRILPDLRNRDEVRRALERHYPQRLIDAGIGGTVVMLFWIDENGDVVRYEKQRSSGNRELDEAAARVVEVMRFSPLIQDGRGVPVIVALPITFEAR